MTDSKYIFFDCMETIVDLYELPTQSDYALWVFSNSKLEHYWNGFDDFWQKYSWCRKNISSCLQEHQEYEMKRRIESVVNMTDSINLEIKADITKKLYMHYWKTYKSQCYIKPEIKEVLSQLISKYKLGVVSNFMVKNGIEELLEINGVSDYFEFIITSINIGWRKPNSKIYKSAIENSGCPVEKIIFVGDDIENDYFAPRRMGMQSIFLDKEGLEVNVERVRDFKELEAKLLG
ncbi:MAG: HAD family hydrolase [Eubacteriales bacterium]